MLCQEQKEWILLWVSKFILFHGWTLSTVIMVERKTFLANPKYQYHVSQCGEHDCSANNKRNGDYYEYPSLPHFTDELWLQEKWWKEKLFLKIQSISIMYPNVENMIVVPIRKGTEIIMRIQVCFISRMNFNYKENGGKKTFFYKSKASIPCIPMWRTWL